MKTFLKDWNASTLHYVADKTRGPEGLETGQGRTGLTVLRGRVMPPPQPREGHLEQVPVHGTPPPPRVPRGWVDDDSQNWTRQRSQAKCAECLPDWTPWWSLPGPARGAGLFSENQRPHRLRQHRTEARVPETLHRWAVFTAVLSAHWTMRP